VYVRECVSVWVVDWNKKTQQLKILLRIDISLLVKFQGTRLGGGREGWMDGWFGIGWELGTFISQFLPVWKNTLLLSLPPSK
jgi:hypothetical protein